MEERHYFSIKHFMEELYLRVGVLGHETGLGGLRLAGGVEPGGHEHVVQHVHVRAGSQPVQGKVGVHPEPRLPT